MNRDQSGERTHPTDILEEWACNPVFESLFIELGPIDPHARVLWKVMDATIRKLAVGAKGGFESDVRREVGFIICEIGCGGKEGDVAPRVTSNEFKERVNGGEKGIACTTE